MTVYWLTRVVELASLASTLGVLSWMAFGATTIVGIISRLIYNSYPNCSSTEKAVSEACFKLIPRLGLLALVLAIISVMLPNKESMILIVGAELTKQGMEEFAPEGAMLREWANKELKEQLTPKKERK